MLKNKNKKLLWCRKVEYLSHFISKEGVATDLAIIQSIKN